MVQGLTYFLDIKGRHGKGGRQIESTGEGEGIRLLGEHRISLQALDFGNRDLLGAIDLIRFVSRQLRVGGNNGSNQLTELGLRFKFEVVVALSSVLRFMFPTRQFPGTIGNNIGRFRPFFPKLLDRGPVGRQSRRIGHHRREVAARPFQGDLQGCIINRLDTDIIDRDSFDAGVQRFAILDVKEEGGIGCAGGRIELAFE